MDLLRFIPCLIPCLSHQQGNPHSDPHAMGCGSALLLFLEKGTGPTKKGTRCFPYCELRNPFRTRKYEQIMDSTLVQDLEIVIADTIPLMPSPSTVACLPLGFGPQKKVGVPFVPFNHQQKGYPPKKDTPIWVLIFLGPNMADIKIRWKWGCISTNQPLFRWFPIEFLASLKTSNSISHLPSPLPLVTRT